MSPMFGKLLVRMGLAEAAGPTGAEATAPLVIPAGTGWEGVLVSDRDVIVHGAVKGSIICPHHQVTVMNAGSVVHGTVRARCITWLGEISSCAIACETLRIDALASSDVQCSPTKAAYQHLKIAMGITLDVSLVHRPYNAAVEPEFCKAPSQSLAMLQNAPGEPIAA